MSINGQILNLTASGTIAPYRAVKVSGVLTGAAATAGTDGVIGYTDGSGPLYSSSDAATSGQVIQLQQGRFFQVESGAGVTAGVYVMPTTGGKVITLTGAGAFSGTVACQTSGADGDIIWCCTATNTKTTSS